MVYLAAVIEIIASLTILVTAGYHLFGHAFFSPALDLACAVALGMVLEHVLRSGRTSPSPCPLPRERPPLVVPQKED